MKRLFVHILIAAQIFYSGNIGLFILHINPAQAILYNDVSIAFETDNWGEDTFWSLVPTGNACGAGEIANGGNPALDCSSGGAPATAAAGQPYADNTTTTEGPYRLRVGDTYDLHVIDDFGDGMTGANPDVLIIQNGANSNTFNVENGGGVFSFIVIAGSDAISPDVTINQAASQIDPTTTDSATFQVVFSEAINLATFTAADISLAGTTGTISSGPTQVAPNDGTTFEFEVTGMSPGDTVVATIAEDLIQDTFGNTNNVSSSSDNQITYNTSPTDLPGFCGSYYTGTPADPFNNANIVLKRVDNSIDFDWGTGSPDPSMPNNNFTVRWEGDIQSDETGIHNFRTRSDDGVRVFIDGTSVINNWTNHAPTFDTGNFTMTAGVSYSIVMEFYEAGGGAVAELDWQKPSGGGFITPDENDVGNTQCLINEDPTDILLSNSTVNNGNTIGVTIGILSSVDLDVSDTHTYTLVSGAGDGDNGLFGISGSDAIINVSSDFSVQSSYSIRIQTDDGNGGIFEKIFTIYVIDLSNLNSGFCASYYNGTAANPFNPSNLILQRVDNTINNNWGNSSPDPSIPNDDFTARWEGYIESDETGSHNFRTRTDDGVRVFVDGTQIIDNWTNHGPTFDTGTFNLTAGVKHEIVMEFYERGGGAVAELNWEKPSGGGYIIPDQNDVEYFGACGASDTVDPNITSTNFSSGTLLPGGNHAISINYNDALSGIDTASTTMTLHKSDGVGAFGADISGTGLSSGTISSAAANYNTNNLDFGKYQYRFGVSDNAGNTSTQNIDFYIDRPEFRVSTGSIDIGDINSLSASFSDTVSVTVLTVGAAFDVTMNSDANISYSSENISNWNGIQGFGYQNTPPTGVISTINSDENIGSQTALLNTNGDRNTYTFQIQLGALISIQQAAGDYEGNINFGVNFSY
ncbi:PA14 domain-containing protein [Candidatus Gracilibacteria bacterium]|nr:PA14 domain-containing protein [Candidatus Gracilibacteria bacterium]